MRVFRRLAFLLVAVCALWAQGMHGQTPAFGGDAANLADLASRRQQILRALAPETVLVMWSAPPRVYSTDTNYEYRQESNLLYLTGLDQEDSTLVLIPGGTSGQALLFVRRADPFRELWFGHTLTPAEVTARTGITRVYPQTGTEVFDAFMDHLLSGEGYEQPALDAERDFGEFFDVLRAGRARVAILDRLAERPAGPAEEDDQSDAAPHRSWLKSMVERHPGLTSTSAGDILRRQRQLKTPYEQNVLTRAAEISADAHVEGMRATRPGRWEYEVEAAIEYVFLKNGAMSPGYPSIVASGPNSLVLHYLNSTRQMQSGELLLVDAAGNFQGLTPDITRTYPVSGRFSPAQRELYDLVLRAQEAGIAAAKPGGSPSDITAAVRGSFAEGLAALGLVERDGGTIPPAQVSMWFPHSPIHGIGVDVHDPLGRLDPGAAFVIEPGLYIRQNALDELPKTPENNALAQRLRPALEKFMNLGIRIEDSFLMTPNGPVMLSARAPRRAVDIERVVGREAR